jgi:solute carrier family 25 (mitochondrial phosphate transporter), member 23/24/25/41
MLVFFAGAGIAAIVATYPLDTVRRRLEVQGMPGYGHFSKSVVKVAWNMLAQEGFRSFYSGMLLTCVKSVPSTVLQVCS